MQQKSIHTIKDDRLADLRLALIAHCAFKVK